MKYINFKRYKFSTVVKKLNTLRYNFLKIFKLADFKRYAFSVVSKIFNIARYNFLKIFKLIDLTGYAFSLVSKIFNAARYNFLKFLKFIDLTRYDLRKIYRYLGVAKFDYTKVTKYLDFKTYNIYPSNIRKIKFISYKFLLLYFPVSIIFLGLLYLIIPTFYNYDKSDIKKVICANQNIECSIRGDVNYSFYPTPRIKIKDLVINDFVEKKNTLIIAEHAAVKLAISNLLTKDKHKFKKIQLNNFKINFDFKNLKKYKNIFTENINLVPTAFKKGQIIFFDGKDHVATINNANFDLKFIQDSIDAVLKGKFLNDNIYISLNKKKNDNKFSTDIILKLSNMNFLIKANLFNPGEGKNTISGNILVKKNKNRFTGIFDYKDNEISINKSNIRNIFLDGKLEGKVKFLPYFGFNLDLNLNSINFTKLYTSFLSLDDKNKKDLFKISNKINGKLNLSTNKIYSKHDLLKSFESRLKFNNGNIFVEQFIISLGKLGAADILGKISNDEKNSSFKFESNVFIDNKKKFLSRFGIYNKKNIPSNLFISGNFDLDRPRLSFYEISDDEKLKNADINYIEKEFNDLMLEEDYVSLFHFPQFKEFVQSITGDTN